MFRTIAMALVVAALATTTTAQPLPLASNQMDVLTVGAPGLILPTSFIGSTPGALQAADVVTKLGIAPAAATVAATPTTQPLPSPSDRTDVPTVAAPGVVLPAAFISSTVTASQTADVKTKVDATTPSARTLPLTGDQLDALTVAAPGMIRPIAFGSSTFSTLQPVDLTTKLGTTTLRPLVVKLTP